MLRWCQQFPMLHVRRTRFACRNAEACWLQAITLGAIGVAAVADIYDRNAAVRWLSTLHHAGQPSLSWQARFWLNAMMLAWLVDCPRQHIEQIRHAAYIAMFAFPTHACMFSSCECALGGGSRNQAAERHGQQPAGEGQEVWSHSSHIRQLHLPSHLYISQPD